MKEIRSIAVVGGGDSGLLTSLILKQKNPKLDIVIIDDFDQEIPQVGKSTFDHIIYIIHELLDINEEEFVRAVKPAWKASVYFKDWCGQDPFHVPFDDLSIHPVESGKPKFEELYYRHQECEFRTVGTELAENHLSPFRVSNGSLDRFQSVAYHLNVDRFNQYLRKVCKKRDIDLINEEIINVNTNSNHIESIGSETTAFEADLYIDATGFRRLLVSELDYVFNEFPFPLDSAIVGNTSLSPDQIVPATVVNSASAGWIWQIDTFDRRDQGYVYSSDHQTSAEATEEFLRLSTAEFSRGDLRHYEFNSGVLKEAWHNNCIAVGNALGFVEPLQSTALTLSASLTEKLANLLIDHSWINHQGVRNIYNEVTRDIWTNVYLFIAIHYQFSDGNEDFWRDARQVTNIDKLQAIYQSYNENGFNSHTEFKYHDGALKIFNRWSFYRLLRSLGVTSDFYTQLNLEPSEEIENKVEGDFEIMQRELEKHFTYEELSELLFTNR